MTRGRNAALNSTQTMHHTYLSGRNLCLKALSAQDVRQPRSQASQHLTAAIHLALCTIYT